MKIHIFGASGSGTTTLGKRLSKQLGWKHLDVDDFYWEQSDPPFQLKVPLELRNQRIKAEIAKYENSIISGSLVSWGKEWERMFDLAVFLYIPPLTRMERLQNREVTRYGDLLEKNDKFAMLSRDFLDWAKKYDNPQFKGRSITSHKTWMSKLTCPVIRIEGDLTVEESTLLVLKEISKYIT